jgi:hypothetical protein
MKRGKLVDVQFYVFTEIDSRFSVRYKPTTTVYYNALGRVNRTIKDLAHDERSIKMRHPPDEFVLTRSKNNYAWGLTVNFTEKNAFNATVKKSVNVYVANNRIVDFEENAPSISEKILGIALSQAATEKKGATKKKKQ